MPLAPEQIKCPRFREHGMVTKRWLPLEEREMSKADGDVFEIDCRLCGKFEYQEYRAID
jgi:hypothetical protein